MLSDIFLGFWLLAMLSAAIAFIVTAYRESAREKAALVAATPKQPDQAALEEGFGNEVENFDDFASSNEDVQFK